MYSRQLRVIGSMEQFRQYIASGCKGDISSEILDEVVSRYGWFTAARVARACRSGQSDSLLALLSSERMIAMPELREVDVEKLLAFESEQDLIEKFLKLDSYRIVADQGDESPSDNDIRTEAELDDEDDIVSEELAEVYLAQGLKSEAITIYRKLSLLNPKKSIYFAELIEQIEKQ